jgi:lipopolysaccharide export system permease protein
VEEELPVSEGKGYFIRENKDPAQMTYRELKAYAADVRRMGFDARRLLVDLAGKASFPLVGLIMTVLAIPFSFAMGRKGTLVGVGLSIVIAMVFWGTFGVFRSLGYSGVLTPFLAAWGADLIFGLGGVVLFFRLRT